MHDPARLTDTRIGRRSFCALGLAALAPAPSWAAAAPHDPALDAFIAAQMKAARIPGLAAGLARDGQVRLARGYGFADTASRRPVTADTMFHIASITKTVTATAVVRLAQAGKLDLDEPVAPHLDFPLVNPHHPNAQVTFRQLLTHTSGISDAKYYEVDFRRRGGDATSSIGDFLKAYLVPAVKAIRRTVATPPLPERPGTIATSATAFWATSPAASAAATCASRRGNRSSPRSACATRAGPWPARRWTCALRPTTWSTAW